MTPLRPHALSIAILTLLACRPDESDGNDGASAASLTDDTSATTETPTTATTATTHDEAPTTAADGADAASTSPDDTATDADATTGSPTASCDDPALVWRTGNKTNYESYPDPGSRECIEFNGCKYVGQFAACENTMPERWVMAHDIVAVFPLGDLALHRLCLRSGDETIVVTVIDTCADSDCDGCCTENLGDADALIDLEKYTNERFGVEDGPIEWADLGPGDPSFDGCN
jgi:hypothetical protein